MILLLELPGRAPCQSRLKQWQLGKVHCKHEWIFDLGQSRNRPLAYNYSSFSYRRTGIGIGLEPVTHGCNASTLDQNLEELHNQIN